jgi:hypothetical protein
LAALVSGPAFAQLITNGSFETNGGIGQVGSNTSASPWTVVPDPRNPGTATYGFIFSNANAFTNAPCIAPGCTPGSTPPGGAGSPNGSGGTVALWGTSADGSPQPSFFYGEDTTFQSTLLQQTVTGLTPGQQYALTFEWAAAQQWSFDGGTSDEWVAALGTPSATNPAQSTGFVHIPDQGFSGWMNATLIFTATDTSENLTLDGEGLCDLGGCGEGSSGAPPFALIDSVALTAVPEPSTWAMILVGFAFIGYAGFRRRRTPAVSIATE